MEPITEYLIKSTVSKSEVRAWQEKISLPTYGVGEEEKNPIFLEKRVYQGSSGAVYPYPVIEKIYDDKYDKEYTAVFIENEYIKVMLLPELGGRIQMAYDKVKKRHFIYYNQVIKPALVGLTGPWISGGIEFNWPQHHRPSTFLPTDFHIENHPDGSVTVWCNEVERMFRTKGMAGIRLYPGKAYIEINVKVYNRTPFPQTFLWWANPAVVVNDDYYSVFPPDVNAVFDHGKRDVSGFPIATGVYYKHDYSAGVDISRYKNIPVPTSYMAIKSKYDFVGGYEEDVQGGLLHVANHHISPGKKQWTWGCGDFGKAWDRNLTDEDGPYIELMTGVYTDNQPDFSWLQPYEEKSWSQYFMPYSEVGYVKNATKDAILNLIVKKGTAEISLYTTGVFESLKIVLSDNAGKVYLEETVNSSPNAPVKLFAATGTKKEDELTLTVYKSDGEEMLSFQCEKEEIRPVPEAAKAAKEPSEISGIEQLFLTGLHLEQYRHATYNPLDYYSEALRREPGDVRCNNAVGLLLMRKAKFAEAEIYFRKAVETLTERNPNPYDGEPHYNLGWSLKMQEKYDEAYDALYKSAWNAAWQDAAYFSLTQIAVIKGNYGEALELIDKSLIRNWNNHKARHLKTAILRKSGCFDEALKFAEESLRIDYFNIGCHYEKYLLLSLQKNSNASLVLSGIDGLMNCGIHPYLEYAYDYANAGLYEDASQLLVHSVKNEENVYPMVYYSLGWFSGKMGNKESMRDYYSKASLMSPDYCFPNKLEEIVILQNVCKENPGDAKAYYYLGNFRYACRQYEDALECWEKSAELDSTFPTVLRNLSLAYYNKFDNKAKAVQCLEKAFELNDKDARVLFELDQLYKKMLYPLQERLDFLEKYVDLVEQRDDLFIERIALYNQLGKYEEAKNLINSRKFHPWEGGEGKIVGQYILCRIELAKQAVLAKNYEKAIALLKETEKYPLNLGEGKLAGAEENDIHYFLGVALRALGKNGDADEYFARATKGSEEPQQAFFYYDQQPDKIFYQGLAWIALKNDDKAKSRFNKLIAHGEKHFFDNCKIDYFAVSLPDLAIWEDDLNVRNRIHCNYVMGLGYLGLGDVEKAYTFLSEVLKSDVNHLGAQIHLSMIENIDDFLE